MTKKINDSQKSVFLDYLSEIERNKIWPLTGELTYKKQEVDSFENYIATQLFYQNSKTLTQEDIDNAIWFIKRWKHNLIELKSEIENDSFLTQDQKWFLIFNIESVLTRMKLILKWVYIEAEKWWFKLDKQERSKLKQEIQELSVKVRWERISDTPHEKFLVLKSIYSKYDEKKDLLSPQEDKTINQFFEKFWVENYFKLIDEDIIWQIESSEQTKKLEGKIEIRDYLNVIKMILEKIYGIKCVFVSKGKDFRDGSEIKENKYDKEWNVILFRADVDEYEAKNILIEHNVSESFRIMTDTNKKNISAWAEAIKIPYIQDYEKLDITRFLRLLEHEFKHVIRARKSAEALPINIEKKIDNVVISDQDKWFKDANSTDFEEWITKFSEEAVSQDIEDMEIEVWIGHIATFIWENYWYEEWKKLLKIYLKLDWIDEETAEEQADSRMRRVKRFFPLDELGAYWKDASYYRSKKNIIKLVQECQKDKDPKKLEEFAKTVYMAKLWEEDIKKFQDMIKSMITKNSYNEIPYEIWKILYTKLSWESLKEMEKKDIRFSINKLNAQQKRALVEILKYTKDSLID